MSRITAATPGACEQARRQIDILRRVAHPNIEELVNVRDEGDAVSFETAEIDGAPFDSSAPLLEVIRSLTGIAAAVAYLHDHGVVHKALDAAHIIVRKRGGIVIHGFASASVSHDDGDKAEDVAAIGTLVASALPATIDPLRTRINGDHDASIVKAMRHVVAEVARPAAERPKASEIAQSLRAVTVGAPLPTRRRRSHPNAKPATKPKSVQHKQPRRRFVLTLSGVGIVALVVGAAVTGAGASGTSKAKPRCPDTGIGQSVDVDGDGCIDIVNIGAGVVSVNDQRYALGTATDHIALGRWTCDALTTPALLEAATGNVYVYDGWPVAGAEASPRLVATIAGAQDITASAVGACDMLQVRTADGVRTIDPHNSPATSSGGQQ